MAPLAAVLVLLALVLPLGTWWAAREADAIAEAVERSQIQNAVAGRLAIVGRDASDHAVWDDTVRAVWIESDPDWLDANVGYYLAEEVGYAGVAIVDSDDRPVYGYGPDGRDPAVAERLRGALEPLLRELRAAEAGGDLAGAPPGRQDAKEDRRDIHVVTRLTELDGVPHLIAAATVAPDLFAHGRPPGRAPALLLVRALDESKVAAIGADLLVDDLRWHPPGTAVAAGRAVVPLGPDPALGRLSWIARAPGQPIAATVLPVTAIVLLLAAALGWMALRHAGRAAGALVASEARARYLAQHDALTGLPNRSLLADRMEHALRRLVEVEGATAAVLCLDLDRFKQVNDAFGHHAGDELLRQVAERLRGAVRDGDTVARLGGDEFAVFMPRVGDPGEVEAVAGRIVACVREPFMLAGVAASVGVSVGIALAPADARDAAELMRRADIALYRCKAEANDGYRFFARAMDDSARLRRELDHDLREALRQDALDVAYQPIFDSSGRMRGVEALLRWTHPTRGPIAPGIFVPIAEESALIVELGDWVLRRALRDAAGWPGLNVAVNVSPTQLRVSGFARRLADVLAEAGVAPGRLELEVTESVFINEPEAFRHVLAEIRALGVRVALDDFGTGYASLSYLRRFDFDRLKIDASFIRDLQSFAESEAIVRAVVALGSALGMRVTAEGVETEAQRRFLNELDCDAMQGFLLSRPVAPETVARLLEAGQPAATDLRQEA